MVKWTRIIYLIIAWLFPVAILVQVLFVGLSLFTSQPYWDAHITLGHSIGILPILLVILGYLGRIPRRTIILTWLALGTYLVQAEVFAAIRADAPLLAAFHPVLALVLFALALLNALQTRTVVRAGGQTSSASRQHTPLEEKGSLASDRIRGR
jgi:Family of unknown function (DUF6220)